MRYKEITSKQIDKEKELESFLSEEGLVVKGVNMPNYMHKDEIRRQAAKLGFTTDENGIPPVWTGYGSTTGAKNTVNKDSHPLYKKNGIPPSWKGFSKQKKRED